MNTRELIENTMLHSLGMLDGPEQEAYQAAYDAAPEPVRQQVRDESRRMADLGSLFPDMEPGDELRPLVLAAVRAAMREEENEARIAGTINANGTAANAGAPARATSQPRLSTSPRVHRAWRIVAVGFAAASIAMGVIMVNISQTYQQAQSRALVASLYDTIGAKYLESTIFDANTQRVAMTSAQGQSTAVAAVWSNPDWNTARLFVKNLATEENKPLRLVVLDEDGNIFREIATFTPNGEFEDFDVNVNLSTERKLAIYPALSDERNPAAVSPVLLSTESTL
ncbi:MAG: hypothetical protein WD114_00925 [Phycisphaerales bacterium]